MANSSADNLPWIPVASDGLRARASRDLRHLPGPRGHWFWGNSRNFMPNPGLYIRSLRERYGECFTVGVLRNQRQVILLGPRANRLVLLDPDDNFPHVGVGKSCTPTSREWSSSGTSPTTAIIGES